MKKLSLLLLLAVQGTLTIVAQDHTILLFDQFVNGKVHFKNHSITIASLNYDAGHGRMLYMQNGEMMELTNSEMIDSVSFGVRQFIPLKKCYTEKIHTKNGVVYVNWILRDINIGSKGAFGVPTQGKVETLRNLDFGIVSNKAYTSYELEAGSTDVFRRKNANTYFIILNGKTEEIKSLKQLIKLFPGKESKIKEYVSKSKIEMKNTYEAIELIDYCLSWDER